MADNNKKATEAMMAALHGLLCETFKDRIENGETIVTKSGDVVQISCAPSLLNAARQFLKDNGIDGVLQPDNPIIDLAKTVQDFVAELEDEGGDGQGDFNPRFDT